jgi:hypothetical protein
MVSGSLWDEEAIALVVNYGKSEVRQAAEQLAKLAWSRWIHNEGRTVDDLQSLMTALFDKASAGFQGNATAASGFFSSAPQDLPWSAGGADGLDYHHQVSHCMIGFVTASGSLVSTRSQLLPELQDLNDDYTIAEVRNDWCYRSPGKRLLPDILHVCGRT